MGTYGDVWGRMGTYGDVWGRNNILFVKKRKQQGW